jgi:DNA-3-methyladenine glycosylase I
MASEKTLTRCPWVALDKPDYVAYHDEEWGVPVHDDQRIFEFLILEGAQAGLSWYTVLRKRMNYRAAFAGFDPVKVARFHAGKVEKLMADAGIIRNRLKILAAINNAKRFLEVQKEFGTFDAYIWGFTGGKTLNNKVRGKGDYASTSPESDALSKDMQKRGFKFVGSTIIYAHMQATGMVNDHIVTCHRHGQVGRAGKPQAKPGPSL